eukprot:XP_001706811.1 Hypothetical protein GL50803_39551 [Giardia lamblia ATCC 50803]
MLTVYQLFLFFFLATGGTLLFIRVSFISDVLIAGVSSIGILNVFESFLFFSLLLHTVVARI